MSNKSYNLEKGFLLRYEWVEMFEVLPPEEAKALLMAIIERQRFGTPLPEFSNQLTGVFARVIEPAIQCRLDGQKGAKTAEERNNSKTPSPTPLPHPPTPLKLSKDKLSKDKLNISGTTYPSPPTGSDVYAERFAEFWKAYPKKVGKEAARKAFMKIKPSADLLQRMLEAIKAQTASDQWKRDNGQYIPNPATWLNQGRWEDEPLAAAKSQNNDMSMEEFFNGH